MSKDHKKKERGAKKTSVCPECRLVARSTFGGGACPKCGRNLQLIGSKYRVPPKGDNDGWKLMIKRLHLGKLPDAPLVSVIDPKADYDQMKLDVFRALSMTSPADAAAAKHRAYRRALKLQGTFGVPRGTLLARCND